MRSTAEKIALVVGLLCAAITAIAPALVVPQFKVVFEGFHAELPPLTTFFVYYHQALWLLPITVLSVWYRWPSPKHGSLASCLIGIIGLVLVFTVGVIALYLPIFNLKTGA